MIPNALRGVLAVCLLVLLTACASCPEPPVVRQPVEIPEREIPAMLTTPTPLPDTADVQTNGNLLEWCAGRLEPALKSCNADKKGVGELRNLE